MIRFLLALILMAGAALAEPIRIKDLVEFDGVRGNDLVGYGLVVGLNGTGDGLRNAPFTEEIMANLLERLGANVTGEEFRPKNVAAVFVTAQLPPFARAGGRIRQLPAAHGWGPVAFLPCDRATAARRDHPPSGLRTSALPGAPGGRGRGGRVLRRCR